MNTVNTLLEQILELCKQADSSRDQILPSTAIDKIRIKAEKGLNKYKLTDTLLCEICREIGVSNSNDLTVNLEPSTDE